MGGTAGSHRCGRRRSSMTRRAPTIRDVARLAGVSTATVSNVLNSRKPVDPALAERVRKAAGDLGYRVHRAASQLRSGRAKVVAMLVPSLENPFFTALIAAIERCTHAEGFEIIVGSASEAEEIENTRLAALLSWRPAGVIIVPYSDRFSSRGLLADERVPFVVADRVAETSAADCVSIDNAGAAAAAARHLIDLGHRNILVAASSLSLANIRERCAGIRGVIEAVPGAQMEIVELGFSFETSAARLKSRIGSGPLPSGAIALTNFTTMALLAAFSSLGARTPDDVSLVGFDDYAWMQAYAPPITAIRQPVDRIAAEAWRCLSARMAGDSAPPRRVELAAHLEIRQSTRSAGPPLGLIAAAQSHSRKKVHG
jgi:LacI family transcriptional regulator, galactose operon repressor